MSVEPGIVRNGPLVSVIIPAYNAARTLEETLISVRNQTYRNLEIIVVDDGSKDSTFELAQKHAKADARILIHRRANGGVAKARNAGIALAKGQYIAPVDADDLWDHCKIERQVQVMLQMAEGHGVVYNWYAAIDEDSIVVGYSGPNFSRGQVFEELLRHNFIGNGSTPLMPRVDLIACGGYDPSLRERGAEGCEDLKLYLALAERLPFELVPDYLTGYRFSNGNLSSNACSMVRSYDMVVSPIRARRPELASLIDEASFFTARWYFQIAFRARDHKQITKLVPLMVANHPARLAKHGIRVGWRSLKAIGRCVFRQKLVSQTAFPTPEMGIPYSSSREMSPDAIKSNSGSQPGLWRR
ncbi:glycosyltransferase family 2 protein [Sinorhizobium numidicum]|uniref:Glycosyltransferase family 2 protein n=1 Tax=Sinorhizobium numidicum TaxID=680248 RepID=A0ABY8CSR2_9HYPH|nr:glycosyltransferase family A protein [Sinorhizobium numidicum]WEX74944.1 glycosyltransferase family 2 protein [Sinorhizobium numidicum]WEX80937.1 glycosyltransferase family 2 protein [Sinorhizobium numidicum]